LVSENDKLGRQSYPYTDSVPPLVCWDELLAIRVPQINASDSSAYGMLNTIKYLFTYLMIV